MSQLRVAAASMPLDDPSLCGPLSADYQALLVAYAQESASVCTFYRNKYGGEKAIRAIDGFEAFRQLPLLRPSEVGATSEAMLLPDRMAAALTNASDFLPEDLRFAKKFTSSGSTGHPKVSYYTPHDWDLLQVAMNVHFRSIAVADRCRVFNCFHPGHMAGKVLEDCLNRAGLHVENRHFTATDEDTLRQLYEGASAFGGFNCLALPPDGPSTLKRKGHTLRALLEADFENFIGRKIRVIINGGFPRDSEVSRQVWDANKIARVEPTRLVEFYGTAEVAGIAAVECNQNDGLHLAQGFTFTEVLNEKTGQHVRSGERGMIVCTGLKQGSRYIRYLVGDEATYLEDPCRCGLRSPRLKNIVRVLEKQRLEEGCAGGW